MPKYDYFCDANGKTVEATHPMDAVIGTWGELCYVAQIPLGDTKASAPVRKLLRPVGINVQVGNAQLKNQGFTKLVKRDDGVYENVTATDSESRYMRSGDPSTMPKIHKKVGD